MKENKLIINKRRLWIMIVLNFIFIFYGALSKIYHWEFSDFFLGFASAIFLMSWFVVLTDIIRNKVYNKAFWLITLFIIPHISLLFYLLQRDRLLRLGHKIE